MSKGFEETKGVWENDAWCDEHGTHHYAVTAENGEVAVALCGVVGASDAGASIANRQLIAEAGTVLHETGLTPRQLAESRAELLEALIRAEKRLRKLSDIDCGCRPCRGVCRTGRGAEAELEGRMETAAEYANETLKAIANATQQRNATGGEG